MAEREAVMGMDVNEAGKMQKIAENFRSVSVFQYNKDIELGKDTDFGHVSSGGSRILRACRPADSNDKIEVFKTNISA